MEPSRARKSGEAGGFPTESLCINPAASRERSWTCGARRGGAQNGGVSWLYMTGFWGSPQRRPARSGTFAAGRGIDSQALREGPPDRASSRLRGCEKTDCAPRLRRCAVLGILRYRTDTAVPALRAPCPRGARDGFSTTSERYGRRPCCRWSGAVPARPMAIGPAGAAEGNNRLRRSRGSQGWPRGDSRTVTQTDPSA